MWSGTARTNYARFRDLERLQALCDQHGVKLDRGPENFAMLLPSSGSDDGDLPSTVMSSDDTNEAEFLSDLVAPLLEPGSVLVVKSAGADRQRYISGQATAYMVDAQGMVRIVEVSLNEIYAKAATSFGVDVTDIAECSYESLPASYERARQSAAAAESGPRG